MRSLFSLTIILILIIVFPADLIRAREVGDPVTDGGRDDLGIIVMDGSGVHDIGELLLHTGNWGIFGSYPTATFPFSQYPSAEWPAGSGVEHLYVAGIWIGAVRAGVPSVSTSAYDMEFMPTDDPIDIIYNSYEGAPGGNRLPSPLADDDGDGMIDEDWLDGHDNDGDGLIDEDFAAISPQMFSSWFADNMPGITNSYPEHNPLDIMVRMETYQWDEDRFDDFVGVKLTVTNIGDEGLEDIYFGMFVDGDVGRRSSGQYWLDDATGYWNGVRCTDIGPAHVNIGYVYDADGDGGMTTSYFGAMIMGHPVDPLGLAAPVRAGINSYQVFSGDQPYENGGDPVNDFQRYDLMSRRQIDRNNGGPADIRFLVSTGPFAGLGPGESLVFDLGLVAGDGLTGLLENAASCVRLYDGIWFDHDGDPSTGVEGRETPVHGPASGVVIDACRPELSDPIDILEHETVWINADCEQEDMFADFCRYGAGDSLIYMTGVAGRETQVHWTLEQPPEPPMLTGALDIKPGTCRNPFNIKNFDFIMSGNPNKGGKMPVAVLGREGFDVTEIVVSTIRLNGVAPLSQGQSFCDIAGPGEEDGPCNCSVEGPDGYTDLMLKFSNREIAATRVILSIPEPGEKWVLTMTGELEDGTAFQMSDCVTFVGKPPKSEKQDRHYLLTGETRLVGASPNPFNPATTIAFELASPGEVSITVYDVSGRMIRSLVDAYLPAGMHEVTWNGQDGSGTAVASGVYFYRLVAGEIMETRKMVLLR
jgi:hypothetical protein